MATIKSYSDLQQSKKLAEILPLESADMAYYFMKDSGKLVNPSPFVLDGTEVREDGMFTYLDCWSLAALLSVLPNNENISTNLSKGGYRISTLEYTNSWFVDYEDETNGSNNCVTSADNPIDACVAMIEKLHELKML